MVSGTILAALREQRALGVEDVADATSISANRFYEFENESRAPTRGQLERIAKVYGVPLYALYADGIPKLRPLPQDFRKTNPAPAKLSAKGITKLWGSEKLSQFTRQIAEELKFDAPDFSRKARKANSATARARELRASFDTWLSKREKRLELTGQPEQRFLLAVRLFFEVQGGVVNVNDAPSEDFMGFCINPEAGLPTIFINRKIQSKKAQLFTFAHEYSHVLMNESGLSNPFEIKNIVERNCNIFAAEFIAPMDEFSRLAESMDAQVRRDVFIYVSAVSEKSLLSRHATAIRLLEGDYISRSQLQAWERVSIKAPKAEKDEEKQESAGGVPHAKRISELGHLTIHLAGEAVRQRLIDSRDVVAGIGLSEVLQERAFTLASRRLEAAID